MVEAWPDLSHVAQQGKDIMKFLTLILLATVTGCALDNAEMPQEESQSEEGGDTPTAEVESALSGGPWNWQNTATLRCLSDYSGGIYTRGCYGLSSELWTNTPLSFGDEIRNKATNRCLDSNTSGSVYPLACNGGTFQQWTVRYIGSLGYEIKNVATGRCLDSDASGSVYTLSCNGGNFQRWR